MRIDPLKLRVRPWQLVSAAWLGPAVLAAFQEYMRARLGDRVITWQALLWQGSDWLICATLTPIVFLLAERFPLRQGRLWKSVPIHLLAAVVFCAGWALFGALLRSLLTSRPGDDWFPSPLGWFLSTLPFGFAVYFGVVAAEHAFRFLLESRGSETQAALLAAQLAEARLAALRMQINPHFLFNSLNTILVMVRDRDERNAAESIERLAGVLRRILQMDRQPEVSLGDEIEFLEQYLAIERARFSDRLRPRFDIAASLRRAVVPALILQPLIENALRHGIGQSTEAGLLIVSARQEEDELVLTVADDGVGLPQAGLREGVGLSNIRERLATMYGGKASLHVSTGDQQGAVAVIRLPFRERRSAPEDRA
jgi:two-component system, LytTR family, sensor kinase